jgi:hypothetical protein
MSFRLKSGHRVYVYSEYVDLRGGFERLSMLIREKMGSQVVSGDLYLFLGKNKTFLNREYIHFHIHILNKRNAHFILEKIII